MPFGPGMINGMPVDPRFLLGGGNPLNPYKNSPSQWGQPQLTPEGQPLRRAMDAQPGLGGGGTGLMAGVGGQPQLGGGLSTGGGLSSQEILRRMQAGGGNLWNAGFASSTQQPGYLQVPGTGEGDNNPLVYAPQDVVQMMNATTANATPGQPGPFGTYVPGPNDWNGFWRPGLEMVGSLVAGGYGAEALGAGAAAGEAAGGAEAGAAGAAGGGAAGGGAATGVGDLFGGGFSSAPGVWDAGAAGAAGGGAAGGTAPWWAGPAANAGLHAVSGGGGNPMSSGGGSGGSGGLFDNFLGNLGNLSPAILAGYLGNRQRQDVMGQVGRLNSLGESLSGPAFMNSITNPYDLQTGQGRTALTQNLQQRGVGGSSFGNQQLGNYDYMRGLGRGDLATRAQAGIAGTQGQLYSDALRGIVGGNAAYNQLLGGGLGASGSLFNRPGGSTGNGLFDFLRNLGGSPGSPTENPYPPTDLGGGGGMDFGNDPFQVPPVEDFGAYF